MLTTFTGEPTKGSNEKTVGSWLSARGHLEKEIAVLGREDFFFPFELSSTNHPSFGGQKIAQINQETNFMVKQVRKEKVKSKI